MAFFQSSGTKTDPKFITAKPNKNQFWFQPTTSHKSHKLTFKFKTKRPYFCGDWFKPKTQVNTNEHPLRFRYFKPTNKRTPYWVWLWWNRAQTANTPYTGLIIPNHNKHIKTASFEIETKIKPNKPINQLWHMTWTKNKPHGFPVPTCDQTRKQTPY